MHNKVLLDWPMEEKGLSGEKDKERAFLVEG
jgi:hypothetical protein